MQTPDEVTFSGFVVKDSNLQRDIDSMNYGQREVVDGIISQYSSVLQSLISGLATPTGVDDMNILASHMAGAASKGDFKGIAISCFCKQGDDFQEYLPVPLDKMDEDARHYFLSLLRDAHGISKSGRNYLLDNKENALELANNFYPEMEYLMGLWYAFDDLDAIGEEECTNIRRRWYEKAALGGYEPAFYDVGSLFDQVGDFAKAAYWYYQGVKVEDIPSCHNLGVMYALGDFVKKDLDAASFYLSLVYRNAEKIPRFAHFKEIAKKTMDDMNIEMQHPPYIHFSKETDSETAELSNVYLNEDMARFEINLLEMSAKKSKEYEQSGDMGGYWFQQGIIASLNNDINLAWECMSKASNLGMERASDILDYAEEFPKQTLILNHLSSYGEIIWQNIHEELKENNPWYEQQMNKVITLSNSGNSEAATQIVRELVEHGSYTAFVTLKSKTSQCKTGC